MIISVWLSNNWIEIFGAVTGIIYVFLEIRQNIWLWPVGIITSAVYIIVFFTSKFYADMGLQGYYLVISCVGWVWWMKGGGRRAEGKNGAGRRAQGKEAESTGLPSLEGAERKEKPGGLFSEEPVCRGDFVVEPGVGSGETEGLRDLETKRLRDLETERLNVTRITLKTGLILSAVFLLLYFLMWFVLSRLTDSPVPEWDSFITSLSVVATWMLARKIYEHWFLWIAVNAVAMIIFTARGLYPTAVLYLVYFAMSFAGLKAWRRSL